MNTEPFKYARDAIERIDSAGFSEWSWRKREALERLAFAENLFELELSKAKTRGVMTACALVVAVDIIIIGLYYLYR